MTTGVFDQEVPFQFLQIVAREMKNTLDDIQRLVRAKIPVQDPKFMAIYQQCLNTILRWDAPTKEQAFAELRQKFPYMQYLYENTYFQVLQNIIGAETMRVSYTIPTMDELVYLFFVQVAENAAIRDLSWVAYSWERLLFLFLSILRKVFFDCIQCLTLARVPLEDSNVPAVPGGSPAPSVMSLTAENLQKLEAKYAAERPSPAKSFKSVAAEHQMANPPAPVVEDVLPDRVPPSPASVVEEEKQEEGKVSPNNAPPSVAPSVRLIEESDRDVENELAAIIVNPDTDVVTKLHDLPL